MTIKATLLIRITLQKYAGSTPKRGRGGIRLKQDKNHLQS